MRNLLVYNSLVLASANKTMSLEAGTRLGPYEILAPIGAGGMGEVWKARDTRLGRNVAIKVLPEEFAKDADRPARFQREAKLLASPQILPDGSSVLFTNVFSRPLKIMAQPLKLEEPKELFIGNSARHLPTGHLVYSMENTLWAVPFDPDQLKAAGGSVPIVEGVFRQWVSQYAVSDSGTLVYIPGPAGATLDLMPVWVSRECKEELKQRAPVK